MINKPSSFEFNINNIIKYKQYYKSKNKIKKILQNPCLFIYWKKCEWTFNKIYKLYFTNRNWKQTFDLIIYIKQLNFFLFIILYFTNKIITQVFSETEMKKKKHAFKSAIDN